MSKRFNVCGIGSALMDILVVISDQELVELGIKKNSYDLVNSDYQANILEKLGDRDLKLCSGGSVANSIIAVAQLGGKGAYMAGLGDDRYGHFFKGEFSELGLAISARLFKEDSTGICISLVTPDGERTMRVSLAAASLFSDREVDENFIRDAEWLFIEGYLFANPERGQPAVRRAVEFAKKHGTKIALTVSDSFVIDIFGDSLRECLSQADLVFANSAEASSLTGERDVFTAYSKLKTLVPNVVLTRSEDGALIHYAGKDYQIAAFPCKPVDVTGAGDMFSGSFLYGITNGFTPDKAGMGAAALATQVISKVGARMHGDIQGFWRAALN